VGFQVLGQEARFDAGADGARDGFYEEGGGGGFDVFLCARAFV